MLDEIDDDDIEIDDADDASSFAPLLPPRETDFFIGHNELESTLLRLARDGTLPHALIFSGQKGIGKATLAYRFARHLLSSPSPQRGEGLYIASDSDTFRKVASGGHPDLLVVERPYDDKKDRYKDSVDIDGIRRIAPFMHMTASRDDGWRVAIVDDADTMTVQAQNAILKILEEPPKRAVLILVCHRLGALIPTIRSRCRIVPFQPMAFEDFSALLLKADGKLGKADLNTLYCVTGGSVGDAQIMLEEGGLAALAKLSLLLGTWPHWNWPDVHSLAETLGRAGQDNAYRTHEKLLRWSVDAIVSARAENMVLPPILKEAVPLAGHYDLPRWIDIRDTLSAHLDRIRYANLDKRQGIIGAFTILSQS